MDRTIFLGWLKINTLFFAGAFIVAFLLALLFPDAMLAFVRRWGAHVIAHAPIVLDPATKKGLFINVILTNIRAVLLFFAASLFFIAPLLAVLVGIFYSLGLVSAIERGVTPLWHSPVLIAIEVMFILLTITFASTLATEIFGVNPERKEFITYWKTNWKKLFPEQKRSWRTVLKENKKEIIAFIIVVVTLILLGAYIEVFVQTYV